MSTKEALQELKTFLEATPPNTPVRIAGVAEARAARVAGGSTYYVLEAPKQLMLHCDKDDGLRRFDALDNNEPGFGYRFLAYKCRDCGETIVTFAVITQFRSAQGEVSVMKLGQYPPFSAPISSRIQKLLDEEDLELYRKGSRAEAQGLGIGAATYFRRIVDEQWKRLVTEMREAAAKLGVRDLTLFDRALNETQFSTAVDMLRDAIPQKLLILDGQNPLTLLYRPLSVQLHALTDRECLQQAADIRMILTALLENIADVLKNQDELKGAAARLSQQRP